MPQTTDQKDWYLSAFEGFEKGLNGASESPIHAVRRAAMARFAELGFPTVRDEAWRATNVAAIARTAFQPASDRGGVTAERLESSDFPGLACSRLVFVNGQYAPELSSLRALPDGVRAGSLAEALRAEPEAVEPHLARHARHQDHAFAALNTAFLRDGAFVRLPRGAVVADPIHLLFVSTTRGEATVSHPRNLIVAGQDSRATILESYAGPDDGVYFTNGVTEVVAEAGAVLDHCKVQREGREAFHVATFHACLGRGSRLSTQSISLGGALVRNDVTAVLDGEDAEAGINGFYLVDGSQHVDNQTWIEHRKPYSVSRELYKGILAGASKGVFRGRIYVHPMTHQAGRSQLLVDAIQSNPNLLLSDRAEISTRPQLEIYADDVRCTHGATVGQIDEGAIFYLRARGIGLEAARRMLVQAFAGEALGLIPIGPVRAHVERLVSEKLEAGRRAGEGS